VRRGVACQDAFAVAGGSRLLSIAVADGLGSVARADEGARAAVDAAAAAGAALLSHPMEASLETVARRMMSVARAQLGKLAKRRRCAIRDLACTLAITAVRDDTICVAHIGDGAVVAQTSCGLSTVSAPENSEYVNEVCPLTSRVWRSHVRVSPVVSGVSAIAMITDGLSRAAFRPDGSPHDGFFVPLIEYARECADHESACKDIERLLAGPKLGEHSDDDKTLVLAVLR
jgi:hypothetical protein